MSNRDEQRLGHQEELHELKKSDSNESVNRFIKDMILDEKTLLDNTLKEDQHDQIKSDQIDEPVIFTSPKLNMSKTSIRSGSVDDPQSPIYEQWSDQETIPSPMMSPSVNDKSLDFSETSSKDVDGEEEIRKCSTLDSEHNIEPGPGGRTLTCPKPGVVPSPCKLDNSALQKDCLAEEFSEMQIKYDESGHVNYYSDTSSEDGINVIINM